MVAAAGWTALGLASSAAALAPAQNMVSVLAALAVAVLAANVCAVQLQQPVAVVSAQQLLLPSVTAAAEDAADAVSVTAAVPTAAVAAADLPDSVELQQYSQTVGESKYQEQL
jgi:hypothetical protein